MITFKLPKGIQEGINQLINLYDLNKEVTELVQVYWELIKILQKNPTLMTLGEKDPAFPEFKEVFNEAALRQAPVDFKFLCGGPVRYSVAVHARRAWLRELGMTNEMEVFVWKASKLYLTAPVSAAYVAANLPTAPVIGKNEVNEMIECFLRYEDNSDLYNLIKDTDLLAVKALKQQLEVLDNYKK